VKEAKYDMHDSPDKKDKQHKEFANAFASFSNIGVTMAACVVVGVFLGIFLDNLLGTSPGLLLFFSLLGVGASFKALFDLAKKTNKK